MDTGELYSLDIKEAAGDSSLRENPDIWHCSLLRLATAWRCFQFVDRQSLITPFNGLVLIGEGLVNRLTPDHGHDSKAIEVLPDAFWQVVVGHASFIISSYKGGLVISGGCSVQVSKQCIPLNLIISVPALHS